MADERDEVLEPQEEAGKPQDSSESVAGERSAEPESTSVAPAAGAEKAHEADGASSQPVSPPDIYSVLRFCFSLLVEQAWVHLGLHLAPGMTEAQMDLPAARVAIDAAGSICEYLKADADEHERRAMELTLTNLRVNFARKAGQS